MVYRITLEPGYLRAVLFHRESMDEVKSFLTTVAAASVLRQRAPILIQILPMLPISRDDPLELFKHLETLTLLPSCRIALLGDTADFQTPRKSVASVAEHSGLNVRVFQDEVNAVLWLQDGRQWADRRQLRDRRNRSMPQHQHDRRHRLA